MPLAGGERFTIHNRIITEEYNKTNTYLVMFISRPNNLGTARVFTNSTSFIWLYLIANRGRSFTLFKEWR